jgi:hypothetical protein
LCCKKERNKKFREFGKIMKSINVEIKSIKVSSFSANEGEVIVAVSFNDGKDKEINKTFEISDGQDAAVQLIRDIRKVETSLNSNFDGKELFENHANIMIKNEENVMKAAAVFLAKVFEKVRALGNKKVADGYMQLVNEVNTMKVEF